METQNDFRVVVRDSSVSYATNALTFETVDQATTYGLDLACRWTALRSFAVVPITVERDIDDAYWSRTIVEENALYLKDY